MLKSDTIAAIMRINRSAAAEFLAEFATEDLQNYLDRLVSPRNSAPTSKEAIPTPRVNSAMLPAAKSHESPFCLPPLSVRT
jgi:hypothetical protein